MTVKSGQAVWGLFTVADKNGNRSNASSTPTGTLYVNGTVNGAAVTVTNISTGRYKCTCTLPALSAGDTISVIIVATVGNITQETVAIQDRADTKLVSDLNDLTAANINSEVVDALTVDVIADSIAAHESRPTIAQALLMITRFLMERSVSTTTVTVNKENGSTASWTLTLDDGSNPTSITRAT